MKSNLELVQELLESRLDHLDDKVGDGLSRLNEKIDSNNSHIVELLSFIREQTTKTNGRVTIVENDIKNIANVKDDHVINCPRVHDIVDINKKIDQLNEENLILKIWNKYPKQLLTFIVIIVIITLGSVGYTLYKAHEVFNDITIESIISKNETYKN